MKKILLYLILILVGVGIGYGLNFSLNNNDNAQQTPEKIYVEKIKKRVIIDTIKVKKFINIPVAMDSVFISDTIYLSDSLIINEKENDLLVDDEKEEVIIMEELISQRSVLLGLLPNDSTDVSELLKLKSSAFAKDIMVEFWKSPLNITGYELTRNRLKLFGFNPNESISLQLDKNEEQILLNTESLSVVLKKTNQFKTLKLK
jgi:hypothetical protein